MRASACVQHYNPFPHMSVLDNPTVAARKGARHRRKIRAHERRRLLDLGLKDQAKGVSPDRAMELMAQQRVARALPGQATPAGRDHARWTSARRRVLDLVRESNEDHSHGACTRDRLLARRRRVVFLRTAGRSCEQGPPEQVIGSHPGFLGANHHLL